MEWETVIGLEIHVQLKTQSKIFSGAAVDFGQEPNTNACAVDLALPGTLPVLNKAVIEMAVQFGLALNAEIGYRSVFERKNYFYPDLPKGYQTTQLDEPIVGQAKVKIELEDGSEKTIRLHHAHLEEDAGKSLHEDFAGKSGIDLNRAGTALIEIVSEPDMRSAEEAVAFLKKIHSIVTYLGISDGEMSQGSMRCDANVSVRPLGQEEYGTRAEIKNINSFRFVERAIGVEVERQIDLITDGGTVVQETRLYDSDKNETRPMRSKEVANDYRYFPCPDLLPVELEESYVQSLKESLPELPDAKKKRFCSDYGLSSYDAGLLTQERPVADYFEEVATECKDAKLAANWINGELSAQLNKEDLEISNSPLVAKTLGQLITRVVDGTISGKQAKQLFETLWTEGGEVNQTIEAEGLKQVSDSGAIEELVNQVIAENPQQVENFRSAPEEKQKKMFGFFVGQVMKLSQGQANPAEVNKILKVKL
ncbi:MAG: Asp-tRNA(Asn)/Glu-tRNA(Gln) amidotransferase subunit GatB [Porticoccaceae bacterium]|mgnify:CR=1 FL=1|jgi:aspartyl-tRNA(Asn)/glutamyl-tRNA(Gln) amidotransferase subunit B|nr:Asp-tRNA(Asn)/Glu-tRNA(Gln) amidotransferase subunit GatB [Porticoccaceae bacterium]